MNDPHAPACTRFAALGSEIVVGVTKPALLPLVEAHIRNCVGEIDQALSRFRPDSELRRLERQPGPYWHVSSLFLEALALACHAAASTDGWFDPTVRSAVEAAGYDRSIERLEREGPGPALHASPAGRWAEVRYDRQTNVVVLPAGVRLDFGGIGKGFAVDYALRTLPHGVGGVLMSAGGDLAVAGAPPAAGWACAIAVEPGDAPETVVALHRGALATSGLGRRQWTRDGERIHHLIDPHSGRPGQSPWRSVTVAARTCVAAEVAAKVAWLRAEDGPAWLVRHGLTGRFCGHGNLITMVGQWHEQQRGAE